MTEPDKHLTQEADIGSGEKTPGERETRKQVEQVHNPKLEPENLPPPKNAGGLNNEGDTLPPKGN